MKTQLTMDYLQRKINSVLFRFVLIAYSIVLLFIYPSYSGFLYAISIVIYLIFFLIFDKHTKLRLLNDFIFINLIILGKNPNDVLLFTYLILPIVNSINFSGKKKSLVLYFYTAITFLFQVCYFNNKFDLEFVVGSSYALIPIVFLWFINSYTELRLKIRNFREELSSVVDNFYLKKEEIKRPHRIYKQLIQVIHENTSKIQMEDIVCFTIYSNKTEKLIITNGSSFIWSFAFNHENLIDELRKKKRLSNVELKLDGKNKNNNLLLYSKAGDQEYIYAFITKKSLPLYYMMIGFFNRTLEPAFKKISNVLLSEKRLQEVRSEEVARLSERSQYVNRANKTMHYIRNRLGPFSNLFKMLEQSDSIPSDKADLFREIMINETEVARVELKNITNRANSMLEKSSNPFVYTKLDKISIERVFTILKRNVYSYFPSIEIDLSIELDGQKKYVMLNEEGFELFLSDWLNNMSKYKKNVIQSSFIFTESCLEITFTNDHKLTKSEIDKLISDLTSDDRNEIMRRTTHGLYTIKLTLEDMMIPFEAFKQDSDSKLVLKLKLKTYNHEDSSI